MTSNYSLETKMFKIVSYGNNNYLQCANFDHKNSIAQVDAY